MNPIDTIRFIEGSLSQFKDVYQCLLEDFPVEEVKGFGHMEELLSSGRYKLLLAMEPNHNVIAGYVFIYVFEGLPAIWLDYLAINQKIRGSGIGTQFFNELVKFKEGVSGMFIEVEKPDDHPGNKREDQLRRIRFYERLGAKKLPISYELPTKSGGFPMYLYYKSAYGDQAPLSKEQIESAINEVFHVIHSDVAKKEAILKKILASIE
ncbi:GNAT family N-acetyltransferase [Pseudoneobacillus sp. C159]